MSNSENAANSQSCPARAAILVLLTLTGVMLLALFTRTEPHPPLEVAPFALGPFFAASLAIGVAAFHLLPHRVRFGSTLAILFALTALLSFGPQKYVDPQFSRVWPALITAHIAVIAILAWSIVALRRGRATS